MKTIERKKHTAVRRTLPKTRPMSGIEALIAAQGIMTKRRSDQFLRAIQKGREEW